MIIILNFFSFNVWKWFLHFSVLERTEFDLWTFFFIMILFLQGCGCWFWDFIVPQGSLISCNIISKCGNDSLMFQKHFLIRIPYSSYLHKERRVGGILWQISYFYYFLSCLGLINTLFSVRIQGLFGLSYGLFSLGFYISFEWTSYKST